MRNSTPMTFLLAIGVSNTSSFQIARLERFKFHIRRQNGKGFRSTTGAGGMKAEGCEIIMVVSLFLASNSMPGWRGPFANSFANDAEEVPDPVLAEWLSYQDRKHCLAMDCKQNQ